MCFRHCACIYGCMGRVYVWLMLRGGCGMMGGGNLWFWSCRCLGLLYFGRMLCWGVVVREVIFMLVVIYLYL